MIAVDLNKQQALDADPRAIQQINFTANLDTAGNTRVYFILELYIIFIYYITLFSNYSRLYMKYLKIILNLI